jgi:hypothetical protein
VPLPTSPRRRRSRALVALVAVVAAVTSLAAVAGSPARADAQARATSQARATDPPARVAALPAQRLFVVADSVVLGAEAAIRREMAEYDVTVGGFPAIFTDVAADLVQRDYLGSLGRVAVVATGYNYPYLDPPRFDRMVDRMMATLAGAGVERVVWVLLRESSRANSPESAGWQVDKYAFYFPDVNAALRRASTRWPQLQLADWRTLATPIGSTYDAIHLNVTGQRQMASLLRAEVERALAELDAPGASVRAGVERYLPGRDLRATDPADDPCHAVASWDDANAAFWAARTRGLPSAALDPDLDDVPCEQLPGAPMVPVPPRPPGADRYPEAVGVDASGTAAAGYWMLDLGGTVYGFGTARALAPQPREWAVAIAAAGRGGYWELGLDGRVHSRGAPNLGDAQLAPGEHAVAILAGPDADHDGRSDGYWIATDRGGVQAFGVPPHGDLAGTALQGAVIAAAPTPGGGGYWLVGTDGGVFSFGDARFSGSMGGTPLNRPVVGVVPDADGTGYWLVAADGGIFAFDATFRGSMGGTPLNRPVVGAVAHGDGYLLVASDGGIFAFSNQPFLGSLGDRPPATPVVAVTSAR